MSGKQAAMFLASTDLERLAETLADRGEYVVDPFLIERAESREMHVAVGRWKLLEQVGEDGAGALDGACEVGVGCHERETATERGKLTLFSSQNKETNAACDFVGGLNIETDAPCEVELRDAWEKSAKADRGSDLGKVIRAMAEQWRRRVGPR